jgi:hypothetical protein
MYSPTSIFVLIAMKYTTASPTVVITVLMTPEYFSTKGGLYVKLAAVLYLDAHLANIRFSEPVSLTFCMPVNMA